MLAIIAGLLLITQLVLAVKSSMRDGIFSHVGMDFLTTYTAAIIIDAGNASDLYNMYIQRALERPLLENYSASWSDRSVHPFVAPPILGLLAVPFSALSAGTALAVWIALSAAAILTVAWLLNRECSLGLKGLLPLAVLSFFPVYYTLRLGQAEAILLIGLTLFLILYLRQNDLPAGLALGLLAVKPPLLVVPIIYLLVQRRWHVLTGLGISSLTMAGISVWLLGWQGSLDYIQLTRALSEPAGTTATNVLGMINIRGTIVRLLPAAPAIVQQIAIATLTLVLVWLTATTWSRMDAERGSPADRTGLSLMITTMILGSYHTLIHTGTLLLPAIALLWQVVNEAAAEPRDHATLAGLVALAWVSPTLAFLPTSTSYLPAVVMTPVVFGIWLFAMNLIARVPALAPAVVSAGSRQTFW